MSRTSRQVLFLSTAIALLASGATPAFAQAIDSAAEQSDAGSGDIIVTARRRSETLQDVPQTVNAVSSDTLEKLRINNAADIASLVPGVSIEGASNGSSGAFGSSSSIRGVPTFLNSNASPVVQFYFNDAPTGRSPDFTQVLFDVGQVEVLKGPQGTLRGRSAPGGAITITAKKPSLTEVGGYIDLSGTTRSNMNGQAAISVPIVEGVLALRVAGVVDHTEAGGITSANRGISSYSKYEAVRAGLLFEPSDQFTANVTFQKMWRNSRTFLQVRGPGNGLNGPAIDASDRLALTDGANQADGTTNFVVGGFEWRFAGQKLTYVGAYRDSKFDSQSPQDIANVVRGGEYYQYVSTPATENSQELRLGSEERIADIFDYTVGVFYDREKSNNSVRAPAQFLSGAFGRPGTVPVPQNPVDRYTLYTNINVEPVATEKSVFGSVTAHLGENTELTAGGRYINYKRRDAYTLALANGFNAVNAPACGGPLVASPIYTGAPAVCDFPVPGRTLQTADRRQEFNPVIYNVSASHKFSRDFMIYGNVGSAFRSAGPQIGILSQTSCCVGGPNLGSIEDLIFPSTEKSTAYEIGFKSTFLDRRARLNVAIFQQDFKNFFFLTQQTQYLSITNPAALLSGGAQVSSSEFTAGADARTRGVDIEAGFRVTPKWDINVGFSYAKARLKNATVPCNDSNFDGRPDTGAATIQGFINAGTLVARCQSSESISRTPNWNLTVQSEYGTSVSDSTDAFIRGNFTYYPDNPNSSQGVEIDKYSLLNLFVGLRSADSDWEVSLFANNLLNTKQVLSVNPVAPVSAANPGSFFRQRPGTNPVLPSGYEQITYTPRREFGLHVRYSFGAR